MQRQRHTREENQVERKEWNSCWSHLLIGGPDTEEGLTQLVQGRLHFIAGMNVARLLGDDDAVRKGSARFFEPPQTRKELPELEISCHISGVVVKESSKIINGGAIITKLCAFMSQTVQRKSVAGFIGDELLQHFPARLLTLGHGKKHRIIPVRTR